VGDWTVLKRSWADGYPHKENYACHLDLGEDTDVGPCYPVVEQHQSVPEVDVVVPEFTIAVSHQPRMRGFARLDPASPSLQQGWKWSICWTGKDGGRKMRTGYGYLSAAEAKAAAEERADHIAIASLPEEVYTYTPEI
jgi:hypothetical protein